MTRYGRVLLGATASVALLGAAPAFAFEAVDWTWSNTVTEEIGINIQIESNIDPTGLVQVEKLQAHFGDVKAKSKVEGVWNHPATGGGEVVIDEIHDAGLEYSDIDNIEAVNPILGPPNSEFGPPPSNQLTVSLVNTGTEANPNFGNVNEFTDNVDFAIRITGTVDVPAGASVSAADLPKVENAATAVANNQSIEADVPLYLHDAQFAAGGFNPTCDRGECPDALGFLLGAYGVTVLDGQLDGINEHTSIAGLLTVGAATGFIKPAEVEAKAKVSDILNAYVDNAATAVTNNASFEVASNDPFNHAVIADLTQWGYADVLAKASVESVSLENYTNFGGAGLGGGGDITPIVSNAATAVGNNLSIKVGGIAVD